MRKRAFTAAVIITWGILLSLARIMWIMNDETYSQAGETQSSATVSVAESRGTIYDCNMIPLTNTVDVYKGSICNTPEIVSKINELFSDDEKDNILERLKKGMPIVINAPSVITATGAFFMKCAQYYTSENVLAPHIIGYLDSEGNGVSGIESAFNDILKSKGEVTATYYLDARNSTLLGVDPEISGLENYDTKTGVALTIDCRIQKICEDAAEEMLPVGAIIVQDISTGDIKACVSMPTYSVTDVASVMDAENSPLINRAFTAYNVGSVFKLCVAAAAIESGIDTDYEYECTGKITLGSTSYNCNNRNGHGVLDMTGGLCNSCNTYFINLALKTGASAIFQMAEKMGFGRSKELCSSIISASGNMPSLDELQNHIGELANFAFGQGKLLATPLQISGMVTAIANGGLYLEPSLVLGTTDSDGEITVTRKVESERIMSSKTAAKLREMMIQVVENGTGKNAGISAGAGGKTASAETGWIINGESATQCWFSGFFPAENSKYTVTVLAENGSSGSASAAPVFAKIAESIIQLDL